MRIGVRKQDQSANYRNEISNEGKGRLSEDITASRLMRRYKIPIIMSYRLTRSASVKR